MIPLLCLCSFLGAFLLFSIQPLLAKLLLPHLGGAPAVWNTAMVFFQSTLLAGYAYAHRLTGALPGPRRQILVHVPLTLAGLALLPPALRHDWLPAAADNPIPAVMALLAAAIALPFLALAATAPLIQRWLADSGHPAAKDPYFLYVASNLGSLLALLAYPAAIEPLLDLPAQGLAWTIGYGLLIPLLAAAALAARGGPPPPAAAPAAADDPPLPRLHLLLLSFAPSSLLLGATTHITTELVAVPLLWVLPLALYLLSFAVVFARRPPISHRLALKAQALLLILLAIRMFLPSGSIGAALALHLAGLFATALVCHGELARMRPPPHRLTEFYLWMSLGGVLGGAFNALAAPLLFTSAMEYPLAMVLAALLRPGPWPQGVRAWLSQLAPGIAFAVAMTAVAHFRDLSRPALSDPRMLAFAAAALAAAVAAYAAAARPLRFTACLAALMAGGLVIHTTGRPLLSETRNFFGTHRVVSDATADFHLLIHGNTMHGAQARDPARRGEPLTYFARSGPLGQMFAATGEFRRVALVGLGAGSTTCYRRPGQVWTLYEIDPQMVELARDDSRFDFLARCAKDSAVVLGDARRSLVQAEDGGYDLIILDAFSSDAIPTHLLTREAMALYLRKLAPGGVLAFHLSNRYLDLEPLVAALAADAGLAARYQEYHPTATEAASFHTASRWAVLARAEAGLGPLADDRRWRQPALRPGIDPWTDSHGNLLSLLLAPPAVAR